MRYVLLLSVALASACGGNDAPPPPSPNQKVACDTLSFCKIGSSGFSCDSSKVSACGQCINGNSCQAILDGFCASSCPGVSFKPK